MSENLHAALAAANLTLTNPHKDGKGNYGAYLTLDTLLDHVRPVLAAQGLSVVQDVLLEGDRLQVVTILMHASGESMTFGPLSGPAGANWQQLGGATSYARRYALLAALGIAGGDDDDAQAHTDAGPHRQTAGVQGPLPSEKSVTSRSSNYPASAKQIGMLRGLMKATADRPLITEVLLSDFAKDRLGFELPVEGLEKLNKVQASALIESLMADDAGLTRPITRTTPTAPDPGDPWAGIPVTGPDGEVLV